MAYCVQCRLPAKLPSPVQADGRPRTKTQAARDAHVLRVLQSTCTESPGQYRCPSWCLWLPCLQPPCCMQILQCRTLCAEDLVGQLEAVAELWGEVLQLWGRKRFYARSVPAKMPPNPYVQVRVAPLLCYVWWDTTRPEGLHACYRQGGAAAVSICLTNPWPRHILTLLRS